MLCGRIHRRTFLADVGMGFTGLALGSMLRADESHERWSPPDGKPHFAPKAKSVIWVFLSGGVSQMETWDPKPALTKYGGKTFADTPYPNPLKSPLFRLRSRDVVGGERPYPKIFPMQVGFKKHGKAGVEMTDWWPELSKCVDELAFVRSMYTTDNDHGAEFQMHTGRHVLEEKQPVVGSWVHYGLGTLNENLPKFVFLGQYKDSRVRQNFDADYLGPTHSGIELSLDPTAPLPFGKPAKGVTAEEQKQTFEFAGELNKLAAVRYPDDPYVKARIQAYELAFRMQMAVPKVLDLSKETAETHKLYGIDNPNTAVYGRRLLASRRLVQSGVRFVLCYLSDYGEWDSHTLLKDNHSRSCARVDKPLAGLIRDLKRTGLDKDVMVVCATEFGRTPGLETRDAYKMPTGRDHHPHGFTVWFAGAGIKKGVVHGATDELGFHAVESPHYVTDIHATVLNRLGLDSRKLAVPGRKRLDIDHGKPIREILT
ncbi:MAG: DUF1501 domain-containing protein [Gemmataceae bacterium]